MCVAVVVAEASVVLVEQSQWERQEHETVFSSGVCSRACETKRSPSSAVRRSPPSTICKQPFPSHVQEFAVFVQHQVVRITVQLLER